MYWRSEWVIIGYGGYFGLEEDSRTRNLINGFVGYGNKDVSEVIGEFKGFETKCPS
jgi:hypothetical protein